MVSKRARLMVTEWGMSEKVGPISYSSEREIFIGRDMASHVTYSEQTAAIIDEEVKNTNSECEIDYIHGTDEVFRLGGKNNATTILLPPIAKDTFFGTIANSGPLPRKSFSMGEASEKRFYMECRQL